MSMSSRYQVLFLDPASEVGGSSPFVSILRGTLVERVSALGLEPSQVLQFLSADDATRIDHKAPLAVVYFGNGHKSSVLNALLAQLRARSAFILPLVADLTQCYVQLPSELSEINAIAPEPSDPGLVKIATRLLEELRLERQRRLVFISYKRSESTGVARQLFHALHERGFDVFLDTYSIEAGRPFQTLLFDRMGDADLLILLDTKSVFSSEWVQKELVQAEHLGLGVLQLLWPHVEQRSPGTELCETRYLEDREFRTLASPLSGQEQLHESVVGEIVTAAESLRARSLAARRTRVVNELCERAISKGIPVRIQPEGHLELRVSGKQRVALYPVVGHPDSSQLHRATDERRSRRRPWLLFDNLGLWEKKAKHLAWLNRFLPARTLPLSEVDTWLSRL